MARLSVWAVLTLCMVALSCSVWAQDNSSRQMVISIKLCERAAEGSKPKVVAEPTIATVPGRAFLFETGGSVKDHAGDDGFDIGTRVNGTFERTGTGTVRLALEIRIGSTVPQACDPQTELFRTETVEIRTLLHPGQTKRLHFSAFQWCDVTVDHVK